MKSMWILKSDENSPERLGQNNQQRALAKCNKHAGKM
jgi:hypothetical protein